MGHYLIVELGKAQFTSAATLEDVPVGLRVDDSLDSELLLDLYSTLA